MSETDEYDYELPKYLIAQHPLPCRTDARLLVVDRAADALSHSHVRDLPEFLHAGDVVVLNDTRVVPARLFGHRERTGGRWVGLFLSADANGLWRVLGQTRGKLTAGETIVLRDRNSHDSHRLTVLAKLDDGSWVARPGSAEPALSILACVGRVPLPPYIRHGEMDEADQEAYQTVFADRPGAIAAPTAGLHFTNRLIEELQDRGVEICRITLHVGRGSFRPIKTERLADHKLDAEWGCLDEATAARLRQCRETAGRVVAVGTTSVRVLETAARSGQIEPWQGETELFIRPPFSFHAVSAMLTNFHLPRSSLLVLVRAFGGHRLMRRAYAEAVQEEYRFFSYGDAMLIF